MCNPSRRLSATSDLVYIHSRPGPWVHLRPASRKTKSPMLPDLLNLFLSQTIITEVTFHGNILTWSWSVMTATQSAPFKPALAPIPACSTHRPHAITARKNNTDNELVLHTQTARHRRTHLHLDRRTLGRHSLAARSVAVPPSAPPGWGSWGC